MKLLLSWLKDYVDFDLSAEELANALTLAGVEIAGIEKTGADFSSLIVAEVTNLQRHPQADKLWLCEVDDGSQKLAVVCGAPVVKVGTRYAFAPVGAVMPDGMKIKKAKLRGIESFGMLCSERELGLSTEHSGLMEITGDWPNGTKLSEVLGGQETILDLEITPNRPDCLSVIGIAREVGALLRHKIRTPTVALSAALPRIPTELAKVTITDHLLCGRYTAHVLTGAKIGPSPLWMQKRLQHSGIRPINNIVDITNYVLLETGHPLHAFDLQKLRGREIIVRRARPGEELTTLDETKQKLTENMLVIADAEGAVAVAGVMGGVGSEITETTADILLESAYFLPASVRQTSKKLGLTSDSSYRFERGTDIEGLVFAAQRAVSLMVELASAQLVGKMIDVYPQAPLPRSIVCRWEKIRRLTGIEASNAEIRNVFAALELGLSDENNERVTVHVPTFRLDLGTEEDLVEEFARIYGLDKIPEKMPQSRVVTKDPNRCFAATDRCRTLLAGLGLSEIMNYSFLAPELLDRFGQHDSDKRVAIPNPVSRDLSVLRTSLLPQMVATLGGNNTRQIKEAGFFEIGKVFSQNDGKIREEEKLAIGLMGPIGRSMLNKRQAVKAQEIYEWLKGMVEALLTGLKIGKWQIQPKQTSYFEEGLSALITIDGQPAGWLGILPAAVGTEWRLSEPIAAAELALDQLLGNLYRRITITPPSAFPKVERDMALLVDEALTHGQIMETIQKNAPVELEEVRLFDVFSGRNVGAGKKSLAYSCAYRAQKRTLTDEEANKIHDKLKNALRNILNVEIRES